VKVGVVGAGALGFHHIRLLKKIEGADLVGFYDHNTTRSAQVAKELETTAFSSLDALLDRVEALTVVVPTPAHVDVGLPVLERDLHALIEKPLADTLPGAEQLVHTARQRGLCLQVGHARSAPPRPIWRSRAFSRPNGSRPSSRAGRTSRSSSTS
jgi:predicted dehydrogenase